MMLGFVLLLGRSVGRITALLQVSLVSGFVCLQMCCNCVSAVLSYDFELAECVPIG